MACRVKDIFSGILTLLGLTYSPSAERTELCIFPCRVAWIANCMMCAIGIAVAIAMIHFYGSDICQRNPGFYRCHA